MYKCKDSGGLGQKGRLERAHGEITREDGQRKDARSKRGFCSRNFRKPLAGLGEGAWGERRQDWNRMSLYCPAALAPQVPSAYACRQVALRQVQKTPTDTRRAWRCVWHALSTHYIPGLSCRKPAGGMAAPSLPSPGGPGARRARAASRVVQAVSAGLGSRAADRVQPSRTDPVRRGGDIDKGPAKPSENVAHTCLNTGWETMRGRRDGSHTLHF